MGANIIANGPLQVDRDVTLWRYVTLPTLLLYLDGRLRLSSISRLRGLDPLEGSRFWDHVTQTAAFNQQEYTELLGYVRDHRLSKNDQESFDINRGRPGANQAVIFEHWHTLMVLTRYALCLFASKHQSIAMWRLYAPHGFAIRTSLSALEKGLESTTNKWRISRMRYINTQDEVMPEDVFNKNQLKEALRRPFFLKAQEYSYENEVRLVTVDPRALPSIEVEGASPSGWIEQIVISPELWSRDAELLKELIESRCPDIKGRVHQSSALKDPNAGDAAWRGIEAEAAQEDALTHWPQSLWEP
jgi:hypothetical protein